MSSVAIFILGYSSLGEYELVKHTVGSIQTLNMVISAEQIDVMETKYHRANT